MAFVVGIGLAIAAFCVVLAKQMDKPEIRTWCRPAH
jgi:hypothetical protein